VNLLTMFRRGLHVKRVQRPVWRCRCRKLGECGTGQ